MMHDRLTFLKLKESKKSLQQSKKLAYVTQVGHLNFRYASWAIAFF
jgi:hypothetical protein